MKLHILKTAYQRAWGAMFRRTLRDILLVFLYPHPARRIFHTFFCPPMRLMAVNEAGTACFNQIVPPGRFVRLPECKMVIESHPDDEVPLREVIDSCGLVGRPNAGDVERIYEANRLVAANVLVCARLIGSFYDRLGKKISMLPTKLAELKIGERSDLYYAAQFLANCHGSFDVYIPRTASRLAQTIMDYVMDDHAELTAYHLAAQRDWKKEFKSVCYCCDRSIGAWRRVLHPPKRLADESAWRYDLPENAVPICRRCAYDLFWNDSEFIRLKAGYSLWGVRFVAFHRLHKEIYCQSRTDIDWNKYEYPLWPKEFGGDTWETGSGCFSCLEPMMPDDRLVTAKHLFMRQEFKRRAYKRKNQTD